MMLKSNVVFSKSPSHVNNVITKSAMTIGASMASHADIVLDCADEAVVQCHILTCRIHGGLRANESAVVRLRSRVWIRWWREWRWWR